MARNPDVPFFTLFNYTSNNQARISIHSAVDSSTAEFLQDMTPEWTDIVERAARGGGQVQIHVIKVPQGSAMRFWVIPLRTNHPQFHNALCLFARSLPEDHWEGAIMEGLKFMLEGADDLVGVH